MSFSLPANVVLPTSPERHNIAVAEIVIFAALFSVQLGVRYAQIWHQAEGRRVRNALRCLLRAWLNFVLIFAQSTHSRKFVACFEEED